MFFPHGGSGFIDDLTWRLRGTTASRSHADKLPMHAYGIRVSNSSCGSNVGFSSG